MSEVIHIIDTGVANISSMQHAWIRLGFEPMLTTSAADVEKAKRVVLPGVGSFAAGMSCLRNLGMVDAVAERVEKNRPLFCVCLGLQLLCKSSEESPGTTGVGVVPVDVKRFPTEVSVPKLGWNRIQPQLTFEEQMQFSGGYAYFANSYRVEAIPSDWSTAISNYGGEFVAAYWKGNVLACQFHPELSSRYGQTWLQTWSEFTC
ncbi:MAG: imidazole glycerol phosphate synthase subunit HisH [Pirellulaceae bacterium]